MQCKFDTCVTCLSVYCVEACSKPAHDGGSFLPLYTSVTSMETVSIEVQGNNPVCDLGYFVPQMPGAHMINLDIFFGEKVYLFRL